MSDAPARLFVIRAEQNYTSLRIPNPDGEYPPIPNGPWIGTYVRADLYEELEKRNECNLQAATVRYASIEELEAEVRSAFMAGSSAGYSRSCAGAENLPSEKDADFLVWKQRTQHHE